MADIFDSYKTRDFTHNLTVENILDGEINTTEYITKQVSELTGDDQIVLQLKCDCYVNNTCLSNVNFDWGPNQVYIMDAEKIKDLGRGPIGKTVEKVNSTYEDFKINLDTFIWVLGFIVSIFLVMLFIRYFCTITNYFIKCYRFLFPSTTQSVQLEPRIVTETASEARPRRQLPKPLSYKRRDISHDRKTKSKTVNNDQNSNQATTDDGHIYDEIVYDEN